MGALQWEHLVGHVKTGAYEGNHPNMCIHTRTSSQEHLYGSIWIGASTAIIHPEGPLGASVCNFNLLLPMNFVLPYCCWCGSDFTIILLHFAPVTLFGCLCAICFK